ncbi:hypothetical protein GQ54DRAFT_298657 [Martensiomyces pterosporus]|nr:hypothetical protein GQ54DRAFT_298657 [Martensiomyces pterosporus]
MHRACAFVKFAVAPAAPLLTTRISGLFRKARSQDTLCSCALAQSPNIAKSKISHWLYMFSPLLLSPPSSHVQGKKCVLQALFCSSTHCLLLALHAPAPLCKIRLMQVNTRQVSKAR